MKIVGLLQLGVWRVCGEGRSKRDFIAQISRDGAEVLTCMTRRAKVRREGKGRVTTVRNDGAW